VFILLNTSVPISPRKYLLSVLAETLSLFCVIFKQHVPYHPTTIIWQAACMLCMLLHILLQKPISVKEKHQDERLAYFGTAVVCCLHWVCRS